MSYTPRNKRTNEHFFHPSTEEHLEKKTIITRRLCVTQSSLAKTENRANVQLIRSFRSGSSYVLVSHAEQQFRMTLKVR